MLTHDSPTLHRLEYEYDGTFPVYNPGTGGYPVLISHDINGL